MIELAKLLGALEDRSAHNVVPHYAIQAWPGARSATRIDHATGGPSEHAAVPAVG